MTDTTDTLLTIIIIYFLVGITFLLVFDGFTGRVRKRIKEASLDVQEKMAITGFFMGRKLSIVVLLLVIWLLWVVVVYGALQSLFLGKKAGDEGNNNGEGDE